MVQMCNTSSGEAENSAMDYTICLEATLKKVKTNKNKYFVLHGNSQSSPAKLEYYNSKKHWDNRLKPRKIIYMKTCFSINGYSDSRVQYGLTAFTKEESMQIGFDDVVERDNWLLSMRSLSEMKVSSPIGATASEHNWNVGVTSRKLRFPIEGMFQLCLHDRQTTLVRMEDPHNKIVLPFEVIREYGHKDSEFILDVGRQADTGPGQIWMALADPQKAQNVYDIFNQNMNSLSVAPNKEQFRPSSNSLSYKDRRSAYRRQTNSTDKLCSRLPSQVAGQVSPFVSTISTSLSRLQRRDRSDSISSQNTSASLSIEELSNSGTNYGSSRCTTPDARSDSANLYAPSGGDCTDNSSKHSTSSLNSDSGYTDMSLAKEDNNSNFMYIDMTYGTKSITHGYVDMTCGQNNTNYNLKPIKVKSFVLYDDSLGKQSDSSSSALTNNADSRQYVPMCRKTGVRKSSPICHPEFFCHSNSNSNTKIETEDIFATLDFDDRNRAKSFTSSPRPRQSSWSQFLRPRSSSHGQKMRSGASPLNLQRQADYVDMSQDSDFQHQPDYVDMSQDSAAYVKMNPSFIHQDKENKHPFPKTFSMNEPFPELSASDDDMSLQSHENSSIKSSTSSDNMSVNSQHSSAYSQHSSAYSQHSSAYCSSLDSEPYVNLNPQKSLKTKPVKPVRVASFIVDDSSSTANKPSQRPCTLSKVPK